MVRRAVAGFDLNADAILAEPKRSASRQYVNAAVGARRRYPGRIAFDTEDFCNKTCQRVACELGLDKRDDLLVGDVFNVVATSSASSSSSMTGVGLVPCLPRSAPGSVPVFRTLRTLSSALLRVISQIVMNAPKE